MLVLATGPFYQAYANSDLFGKFIFASLFISSICSWSVMIHKCIMTRRAAEQSRRFHALFHKNQHHPLGLDPEGGAPLKGGNPFYELYAVLKKHAVDLLNKNHRSAPEQEAPAYLSASDIDYLASHLDSNINLHTRSLEEHLYVLSTVVGLAPLLGLLGTVWGILLTFSGMQSQAIAASNQMMLGGIALALTTTVLGLFSAIPALIGYSYLKNAIRNYQSEMEGFSNEMLAAIEMRYRKVDVHH